MNAIPTENRTVSIVDDDEPLRTAISRLLRIAGFHVETYASAAEFLLASDKCNRGCILLDVRMPGGPSGLELHRHLLRQGIRLPVIFMTGHGDVPMSVEALKGGASDFLIKPVRKDKLLESINTALEKEAADWEAECKLRELRGCESRLSSTERKVFSRMITGEPNKQIADELGCSERTVKAHRAKVMEKMKTQTFAELIQMASVLEMHRKKHPLG